MTPSEQRIREALAESPSEVGFSAYDHYDEDDARFIIACNPTAMRELLATLDTLRTQKAALVEALESIRQYGSDTLSGPASGPNDRAWQREGVIEMTKRARAALAAAKE